MSYSIILPTVNEQGHIVNLIHKIIKNFKNKSNKFEIIIVDDNSTDGTVISIKKSFTKNKKIKVFKRLNKKKSLPKSISLGISKSKYENIIWLDADFQHPPEYIKLFLKYSKKYDVVFFSRFLKKSIRYFDIKPKAKEFNENQSVFFNKMCNLFFYKDITDYTSGYICIKKKVLKNYSLTGYYVEYFISLILYCKKKNLKILELPFKESIRKTGYSKTLGKNKIHYLFICLNYFLILFKNIMLKIFF